MLKLFFSFFSPPSRAVLSFLKVNRIPHEVKVVNLMQGEQFSPEFVAINPVAQVPAINDNGFNLSECQAILTYLHSSRQCPDHWYPADIQKRAQVDRCLHWYHTNIRMGGTLFRKKLIDPIRGIHNSPQELADTEALLKKSLKQMDAWLGQTAFLAGSEVTVADLAPHAYLHNLKLISFDLGEYPKVMRWAEALDRVPEIAEVSRSFFDVAEKMRAEMKKGR